MARSFFHLAPDNDPCPITEPYSYCNPDDCADYSEVEHDAILQESEGLTDALFDALDAYSEAHPQLTYEVILHAIDCLAYCIRQQMGEDTADA